MVLDCWCKSLQAVTFIINNVGFKFYNNLFSFFCSKVMITIYICSHKGQSYMQLAELFPKGSPDPTDGNFVPSWFLVEKHKNTSFAKLKVGWISVCFIIIILFSRGSKHSFSQILNNISVSHRSGFFFLRHYY